jgi:hypothetical protein
LFNSLLQRAFKGEVTWYTTSSLAFRIILTI